MENLLFRYKWWGWSMKMAGMVWLFLGIAELLFTSGEPLTKSDWIRSIVFVLFGVMFFTPLVGYNETRFMVGDGNLKIKWRTRIREITILDTEIDKIILGNKRIEILRKGKKPVLLSFGEWLWKAEDKARVYEFLIGYAQQKNLILEK